MLSLFQKPKPIPKPLFIFATFRLMGGGPRTFPGGLNKWQWKRLHENKAKDKEKRLLDHEKQLYQARIRSSIRAKFDDADNLVANKEQHGPRSAEEHIKMLADRFMKEGAEDLWNEKDGPVKEVLNRQNNRRNDNDHGFKSRDYLSSSRNLNGPVNEVPKLVSVENNLGFSGKESSNDYGFKGRESSNHYGFKGRETSNDYGFRTRDYLNSSRSLNGGLKMTKSYSVCSGDLNGSVSLMNLNDGFKFRNFDSFSASLIKTRNYSVSSGDLNGGCKSSFLCKSVSLMNLNDGFKFRNYYVCGNFRNNPMDYCSALCNSVSLRNFSDGFEPRCYAVHSINSNDGFKVNRRLMNCNGLSLNSGIKPDIYSSFFMNTNYEIRSRNYCCFSMNLDEKMKHRHYSTKAKGRTRSRFDFSDDSSDEEISDGEKEEGERKGIDRKFTSSAALGKYDKKKTRRVPLNFVDAEEDLSKQVEAIRNEVRMRNMVQNAVEKSDEDSILSQKRFDECNVSPLTVKALTQAGYVQMTRVQEATLSVCLEGSDALVKAKTGTGKSAAFLLPAIEAVLKALIVNKKERAPPVYVLILCPTRELASQIAAEANVMLKYHEGIGVQTLVGGTRFKVDQKLMESDPCQIVVATPGRLLDHIESKSRLSVRLLGLKMLILDEADHLLDLGFRKDIEKIVDCLPRERQSLLLSATIPKEVRRISQLVLKREHALIDTVGLGCVETPAKVKQFKLVVPHDQHFEMVHHLLNEHITQTPDYKVIVFCSTAMVTSLMFLLLREFKMNVREIHSRKPQIYRTRISEEFKEAKRQILISSDVSARGMNYPDVTLVIQVGIPSDREHYIHRLGRTGREGKEGEGILLLAPWEKYFLDDIKDLPIATLSEPCLDPNLKTKVEQLMAKIDPSVREAAYHAWLGYYNSIGEIGRDKTTLAELANQFSHCIGLEKPPSLFRKTALKMGLRDIPGIRIRK